MVDYKLLGESVDFYKKEGFNYIEAPWYVSDEIKSITRPENCSKEFDYYLPLNNKFLVASGEQSFLYLYSKGFISEGTYQTITPCFRFEEINILHKKVFMKNELIKLFNVRLLDSEIKSTVLEQLDIANAFFSVIGIKNIEVREVKQSNSIMNYDIEADGIELGSYGYREYKDMYWIYSTGCAEPRTSIVLRMQK